MSKFHPWVNTANANVQTAAEFESDTERINGFQSGTTASSKRVNSALRQSSLVACAMIELIGNNTLSLQSSVAQVKNAISGYFQNADNVPNLPASKVTNGIFALDRIPVLNADRIPSLNASKITAGTLAVDRIPALNASKITAGEFATDRIPALNANKITAGTLNSARLPSATGTAKGAVTLNAVIDLIYPVGSVYTSVDSANPNTKFGVGTWVQFAQGRTLVGVDTAQTEFNTVQKTGGVKEVALTSLQMPQHKHSSVREELGALAMQLYSSSTNGDAGSPTNNTLTVLSTGTATTVPPLLTGNAGGNCGVTQPHTNLQPYITVYFWRRTA